MEILNTFCTCKQFVRSIQELPATITTSSFYESLAQRNFQANTEFGVPIEKLSQYVDS